MKIRKFTGNWKKIQNLQNLQKIQKKLGHFWEIGGYRNKKKIVRLSKNLLPKNMRFRKFTKTGKTKLIKIRILTKKIEKSWHFQEIMNNKNYLTTWLLACRINRSVGFQKTCPVCRLKFTQLSLSHSKWCFWAKLSKSGADSDSWAFKLQ